MEYCYRCGHDRDSHRKIIKLSGSEYIDCLKRVKEGFVCQCQEYVERNEVYTSR